MDFDDVFGPGVVGGRPDHPDFLKLANVLLKMDSGLDPRNPDEAAKERQYQARLAEVGINPEVLAYAASQRAFRLLGVTDRRQMLNPETVHQVMMLASIWVDAFVAGAYYERGDS